MKKKYERHAGLLLNDVPEHSPRGVVVEKAAPRLCDNLVLCAVDKAVEVSGASQRNPGIQTKPAIDRDV